MGFLVNFAGARLHFALIGVAVIAAVITALGARYGKPLAAGAPVAGAVAIGATGLADAFTRQSIWPRLPPSVDNVLKTMMTEAGEQLPAAALWAGALAILLAALLWRFLALPTDASASAARSARMPAYIVTSLVVATIGSAAAAAALHQSAKAGRTETAVPASNVWIAQLASVPYTEGEAALRRAAAEVRAQVPEALILRSDDYGSYDPGYWVVYVERGFKRGADVLAFCDSRGRTTRNSCIGHFLTADAPAHTTVCLRADDGKLSEGC
jgi:hypothetical protein